MARSGSVAVTRSYIASVAPHPAPQRPTPPPALLRTVPSATPSPHFTQHHDVAAPQVDTRAFRQGWRITTRLDALFEAGRIDREQYTAVCEFRAWAEQIGVSHVQRWDVRPDAPCHPSDLPMLRRVQTAAKLRACADAVGELRIRLLDCCIRDLSWREIGARLRVSDKTATIWVVEAIAALSAWRCGDTVPPPPVLRYRIEPGRQ
jgi:hypothetical protein